MVVSFAGMFVLIMLLPGVWDMFPSSSLSFICLLAWCCLSNITQPCILQDGMVQIPSVSVICKVVVVNVFLSETGK